MLTFQCTDMTLKVQNSNLNVATTDLSLSTTEYLSYLFNTEKNCPHCRSLAKSYDQLCVPAHKELSVANST